MESATARLQELSRPRSSLPSGRALRAAVWRLLSPMPPAVVDDLKLWEIGALLGHDMRLPDAEAQAEAEQLMEAKIAAVRAHEARRRGR